MESIYPPIQVGTNLSDQIVQVNIPRNIFQTWKTKEVPDRWKTSPDSIRKHMPSWNYHLVDDQEMEQVVQTHFPDFYPYWKQFKYPIQRVDAWRYCMLYLYGGIYLDLDFEILKPLDSLFTTNNEVYLVKSGNVSSTYTNAFLASKPGAQIWLDMIEYMKNPPSKWYHNVSKHLHIMYTTGPLALNQVANKTNTVIGVLPSVLVNPCSVCKINQCREMKQAWIKQLDGSSWHSWDSTVYNMAFCNWKILVPILLVIVIILIAVWLWWKFNKSYKECGCQVYSDWSATDLNESSFRSPFSTDYQATI